jgi:uncharacterized membrane protein
MSGYKERVRADLERWIAAGWVAPEHREALLASVPDTRRLDAATALAWAGAVLFGAAAIAFVAANWEAMTKLTRFAVILAAFLGVALSAAWAANRQREITTDIALTVAALLFAAAVGLTGQIFDIASDPRAAAYMAGVGALALSLAGRSRGAGIVALAFITIGDFSDRAWFDGSLDEAPWLLLAAPLGGYLALRWNSAAMAHMAGFGAIACLFWFAINGDGRGELLCVLALISAGVAAYARRARANEERFGAVFYGWFAAAALLFFAVAGYQRWFGFDLYVGWGIAHRFLWIVASAALVALSRYDRHAILTAIGVVSLVAAIFSVLGDLQLDLLASALVFLVCAGLAGVGGLVMRGRRGRAP